MQYSLVSRFRGGLLGSWVAAILSQSNYQDPAQGRSKLILPKPENIQIREQGLATGQSNLSQWEKLANCASESLIRCGSLNLEDWLWQVDRTEPSLVLLKGTATSSEVAVATLPIAIFFHDNLLLLRKHLLQASTLWLSQSQEPLGILAMGLAIALALTEKLNPTTLIPQILVDLGISQTPLVQQLEQVQTLLKQGADLETTITQLRREQVEQSKLGDCPDTAIALAFYCFLQDPEDFRLAVTRAVRSGYQPHLTATLTGALSGIYNSMIGIPVGWRIAANQFKASGKRRQLADYLFAIWSGVCDISLAGQWQISAVAAPGVIQPR